MYKWRKWRQKWSHSSSPTGLKCLMRLVKKRWAGALLSVKCCCFCVKTIVKESCNFDLAHLKKKTKKKEKHFGRLATFTALSLGVLFTMKTFKDEQHIVIKAYKFTILRFWDILSYHRCVSMLSIHIESTDSTIRRFNRTFRSVGLKGTYLSVYKKKSTINCRVLYA